MSKIKQDMARSRGAKLRQSEDRIRDGQRCYKFCMINIYVIVKYPCILKHPDGNIIIISCDEKEKCQSLSTINMKFVFDRNSSFTSTTVIFRKQFTLYGPKRHMSYSMDINERNYMLSVLVTYLEIMS